MEVLEAGVGEFRMPDPDGFREYVRTHKERRLVNKVISEKEAISRFVEAEGQVVTLFPRGHHRQGHVRLAVDEHAGGPGPETERHVKQA